MQILNIPMQRRSYLQTFATASALPFAPSLLTTTPEADGGESESWPQIGYNTENTGHARGNSLPSGTIQEYWNFTLDERINSVFSNSNTVFLISGSTVYALSSQDGTKKWLFNAETNSDEFVRIETATVSEESIFVATTDSLYAISTFSGNVKWKQSPVDHERVGDGGINYTTNSRLAFPTVKENVVYVPRSSSVKNEVYALDKSDGSELWTSKINESDTAQGFDTPQGYANAFYDLTKPAISDDTLYINSGKTLYAVSIANGEEEWKFTADGKINEDGGQGTNSGPIYSDGVVYIRTGTKEHDTERKSESALLYSINAEDGSVEWEFEQKTEFNDLFYKPVVIGDFLYLVYEQGPRETDTINRYLYAIDRSDGTVRWKVDKNVIWIRGANETLYARLNFDWVTINKDNGEIKKRTDITAENGPYGLYPPVVNGKIYAQHDGKFHSYAGDSANSNSGGVTTFLSADNTNTSIPLLIGGILTGGGYAAYKKFYTSDESPSSTDTSSTPHVGESNNSETGSVEVSSYESIEIQSVIEQNNKRTIELATVAGQRIWVVTPPEDDTTTLSTDVIDQFTQVSDHWEGIESHPNVLSVYGTGMASVPWLAVEKPTGSPLQAQVDTLSTDALIAALQQVCDGLHHVSRYGSPYKHLTTESIYYTDGDVTLRCVLDEFESEAPWYNAPEEFDGDVTEQTLVYRLGVVAYELLTGTLPYADYPTADPKQAIETNQISPPSEQVSGLPAALDEVLLKALSKDPEERFETVLHFRDRLGEVR